MQTLGPEINWDPNQNGFIRRSVKDKTLKNIFDGKNKYAHILQKNKQNFSRG
jgi:hypothetical protein